MSWKQWFSFASKDDSAYLLYQTLVTQARSPQFYLNVGVPDTLDGRFDMIVLHMFLMIDRLSTEREATIDLRQRLFDVMFDDMDQALREIGVGDLSVGKKVKTMARAFYGRLAAYDEAFRSSEPGILEQALKRNVFAEIDIEEERLQTLGDYMLKARKSLGEVPLDRLAEGESGFPPAPEAIFSLEVR